MCTVIIRVPEHAPEPVRLLAVRDEDPGRAWNRLGPWWPDAYPGVIGIRDARAGGAWLAADPAVRRLAVLLNRADLSDRADEQVQTRGSVALESVAGRAPAGHPPMRGFNLVEVTAHTARVVSWDGVSVSTTDLPPGTHMVAHDDVDDADTARIAQWLPEFREAAEAAGSQEGWWTPWLAVVERSAQLPGTAEAAIIRRQSFEGIPSYSLLLAVATVGEDGLDVRDAPLAEPGQWPPVDLAPDAG
ncbi:NRDE family protein [Microbacterium pygmaeum]|uniref:Transport and Golgi organisation 2 n=1 Tax=Microbacterium pygmaeum TaxID=370764 RepID=A0A1G7TSY1_9MICO|nr:NRDE family protein [Microbacterium pygmaeum]SDG38433.1 Transport and Golgi organisation 2 [Microbacterium pygmaeum]